MNWLIQLAGCVAAMSLMAASLTYLFNPKWTAELVKKLGLALAAVLVVPVLIAHLIGAGDRISLFITLMFASITAYFIRERRMRRRERPRRIGRAERKPVLPRVEEVPPEGGQGEDANNDDESAS